MAVSKLILSVGVPCDETIAYISPYVLFDGHVDRLHWGTTVEYRCDT